ncbi:MAG: hypothetical protein AAF335_03720, partial [Bacteroidota bacterium]
MNPYGARYVFRFLFDCFHSLFETSSTRSSFDGRAYHVLHIKEHWVGRLLCTESLASFRSGLSSLLAIAICSLDSLNACHPFSHLNHYGTLFMKL